MSESGADNPLQSRVEDLFSNAVERQVQERRAVGRALEELGHLVRSLDERVAGIESSARQEALLARMDRLAQQVDERLTRVEAAEGARDREARDQLAGIAEHVDGITARLQDVVAEGVEQLARRQDENQQAIERAVLSAMSQAPQGPAIDPNDIASTVVERLPAPPPPAELDIDAVARRVVEMLPPPAEPSVAPPGADEVAQAVAARLPAPDAGLIAGVVAERLRPPDAEAVAALVLERLRDQLPSGPAGPDAEEVARRVQETVPTALQVASAVDASIRDGLVSVVDDVRAEIDRIRDEVLTVRAEVSDGISGVPALSARLGAEVEDLGEALAAVRMDIARADGDRDAMRQEVTGLLDAVRTSAEQANRGREGEADLIAERLVTVVDERLGEVVEARMAGLDEMRADLRQALQDLRRQLDDATSQLGPVAELGALVGEQSQRLDRLAVEVPQSAAAAFEGRAGGLVSEVEGLVRELATELGAALATVAERAEAASATNAEGVADLKGVVAGFEKHLEGMRTMLDKAEEDLAGQTAALETMSGDVTSMGDTVGRVMGELQAQAVADQQAAIEKMREILEDGAQRLDTAGQSVTAQADHAVERLAGATEVIEGSSADLRAQLEAALDEIAGATRIDAQAARDEVIAAGARLDLLFDRLAGFERAVVEHLSARDQQFTRERALIVEELVEQLTSNLSKRDKKKLAAKLEVPPASAGTPATAPVPSVSTPAPGDRSIDVEDRIAEREDAAQQPAEVVPKVRAERRPARRPSKKAIRTSPPSTGAATADAPKPAKKATARKATSKKAVARKSSSRAKTSSLGRQDLIDVKGLGPAKADALLEAFGSADAVAAASVADLAAVPGISERLAKAVHSALR